MMKVLFFWMMVIGVCSSSGGDEKDHNKEAHQALCDLLKAAVKSWGEGGASLPAKLKTALEKTIFGSDGGENDLGKIKAELPKVYQKVNSNVLSRVVLCGQPLLDDMRDNQARWSGHSAPHDLLCLCTPGNSGWPLNLSGNEKLCGKEKSVWGNRNAGWTSGGQGKDEMIATWTNVTRECLEDDGRTGDLQKALDDFKAKLKQKSSDVPKGMYRLGTSKSDDYPCSGNGKICVIYHIPAKPEHSMPWWMDLEKALQIGEDQKEKQKKTEEEKRAKDDQKQQKTQRQGKAQAEHTPRTAALKSTKQDTTDNEQINPENTSNPIATLEDTSSTPISLPSSWLLSAVLLI
ncbi:Variant surface glycoprotein [Trypanosoma congolense IL3000]|uniref:Variant surface glycoprotein n=1 Tax=Trypanosoma congolense (strain IL3000) TaxID=1068625 RepID=F9WCQ3_TRYCI|nr:Variant surface glycoprotein [Trypanosoma congolense IL3000]